MASTDEKIVNVGRLDRFLTKCKALFANKSDAIKSISRSGTTFTATRADNTTFTFTQQDNNTWTAMGGATSSAAGTEGYVPAPPKDGYNTKYLRADGTWTVPPDTNSDTKNTAGSTDSSKKLFLIGAESQAANPQTYSHDTAYVGTDGCLYSGSAKVLTSHQDISGKKNTQSAVSDPTASGETLTFIDSISQNAQGVITPTKKTVTSASANSAGLMSAADFTKLAGVAAGANATVVYNEFDSSSGSYALSANCGRILGLRTYTQPQTFSSESDLLQHIQTLADGMSEGSTKPITFHLNYSTVSELTGYQTWMGSIAKYGTSSSMRYSVNLVSDSGEHVCIGKKTDGTVTISNLSKKITNLSDHIVLLDNATRHTRKTDFSLSDLQAAVVDQNLELHGLQVGDQKTINGHTYVIAGLNVMKGTSDYTCTSNHVGLIVIPHTTQAWNASGNTYTGADSRGAGYKNCDLQYYLANTVMGFCNTDLGSSHLYQHKKLFGKAINTTGYNRFGTNTGCTSGWEWVDAYISALTEAQVFGGDHWSSSGYDTGEADTLLPVFAKYKHTDIFNYEYPWLRNVSSASQACFAADVGVATCELGVGNAAHVAGLILYH